MTEINYYKIYLDDLVKALGYDPAQLDGEFGYHDIIKAAEVLNRVRVALMTSHPEKTQSIFITSVSDDKDETGFPNQIGVCIEFGSNVTAIYERKDIYCHEGA